MLFCTIYAMAIVLARWRVRESNVSDIPRYGRRDITYRLRVRPPQGRQIITTTINSNQQQKKYICGVPPSTPTTTTRAQLDLQSTATSSCFSFLFTRTVPGFSLLHSPCPSALPHPPQRKIPPSGHRQSNPSRLPARRIPRLRLQNSCSRYCSSSPVPSRPLV